MGLAQRMGPTDVPLLEQTIGDNLTATVAEHGDRLALVVRHQDIRWSYDQFAAEVDRVARGLFALGIEPGDRVGIWSPNHVEWVLTQYATAKIGAILVCINPAYRAHELAYVLGQSGCRLLVSATEHKGSDYRAMVDECRADLPALERTVYLGTDDWHALLAQGEGIAADALEERAARLSPNDPINIQYTSGTTGFPKGATLTHRNILNNGYFVGRGCRYTADDRICIPVPFYHCFGMVLGNLAATTHGAAMVVPGPSFEALDVLEASKPSAARRCTGCRPCSSPSSATRSSTASTCRACEPASWPARPARSR